MRADPRFLLLAWLLFGANAARAEPPASSAPAPARDRGGAASVRYAASFFADKNPKTALDMVNLLPGFTLSVGDTSMRGYTDAAGNVLIDGQRPATLQFTLDQVLQRIPVEQVDYIEVIHGDRPGIDMLGQTVVANVVRKKTAVRDTLTLTAQDAAFGDGRDAPSITIEGTAHGRAGQSFAGAFSVSKYVELADGDGPQVDRNAAGARLDRMRVTSAAGGNTGYAYGAFSEPLWAGKLSLDGSLARTDYTYRETDQTSFPTPSVGHVGEYLGGPLGGQLTGELGAHFTRGFGPRWTSESVLLVNFKDQSYKSSSQASGTDALFHEHDRGGQVLGRSDWRYAARRNLTAELSLEGAYNWLHTSSAYAWDDAPVPLPDARAAVAEVRGEAAGKLIWSIDRTWQLEVGFRLETSTISSRADTRQRKRLTYFKPRTVLTITPDGHDQLQLRVEREVSQLDFTDFVASSTFDTGGAVHVGDTSIAPQQSWTLEATWDRRFWSQGDLTLTVRRDLLSDVIDRVPIIIPSDPAATFDAPGNIGDGVEDALIAGLTAPLDRFGLAHGQLKATGAFLESEVVDPTTGIKRAITGLDRTEYALSFRQTFPRTRTAWGVSFTTPCSTSNTAKGCTTTDYRFDEVDIFRADGELNAFFECQPWAGTTLHFEADNMLQARYDRVVDLYPGPRNQYPLSSSEDRRLTTSASFLVSLRRTF